MKNRVKILKRAHFKKWEIALASAWVAIFILTLVLALAPPQVDSGSSYLGPSCPSCADITLIPIMEPTYVPALISAGVFAVLTGVLMARIKAWAS